jgi:large subunit ribosomal protein L3
MTTKNFLLAQKKGMTQIFREDGSVVPVTVLDVSDCAVTMLRTPERDGYSAVQVGLKQARDKHVAKPQRVAAEKAGVKNYRSHCEFRVDSVEGFELGQELTSEVFTVGEVVDIAGKSKGRGFAGSIKAHGFRRGNETHGCQTVRAPGSIGQCAYPGRVFKGTRMAKHYGNSRFTIKNSVIEGVDVERGLLLVRGGVPGPPNGLIQVSTARTGIQPK